MSGIRLFDAGGRRLYLSAEERERFLAVSRQARPELRTLCDALVYTGARISEALELTPMRIDIGGQRIVIRSLKKRRGADNEVNPGYAVSQRVRKRIEEFFGWLKTVAGWRESRLRGLDRTEHDLDLAAYNLTRMPKLLAGVG